MARTIEEIKKEMTDVFMADETVRAKYGFEPGARFSEVFSKVSVENILFYLHAARTWTLETLFDKHLAEVSDIAERKRPHTLKWYRDKALSFQYGCSLSPDVAEYDNTGMTEDEVAETQIVKKCSVQTTDSVRPTIQVKAAKEEDPLTSEELEAFSAYMAQIADAGLTTVCVSGEPDILVMSVHVIYDPLVMDGSGIRYVGGDNVVADTVTAYLSDLEWNGDLYLRKLEQRLMEQDGIRTAHVTLAQAGPTRNQLQTISEHYTPYYGAIQCGTDNDLTVTYERF